MKKIALLACIGVLLAGCTGEKESSWFEKTLQCVALMEVAERMAKQEAESRGFLEEEGTVTELFYSKVVDGCVFEHVTERENGFGTGVMTSKKLMVLGESEPIAHCWSHDAYDWEDTDQCGMAFWEEKIVPFMRGDSNELLNTCSVVSESINLFEDLDNVPDSDGTVAPENQARRMLALLCERVGGT